MGMLALDCSQPLGGLSYITHSAHKAWAIDDASASQLLRETLSTHKPTSLLLGVGPGRLSGLRSSASFMAGLSRALSIPIYTVSSLLIIATHAHEQYNESMIQVVIDARLGQYFVARYAFLDGTLNTLQEACITSTFTRDIFTVGMLPTSLTDLVDVIYTNISFPNRLDCVNKWVKNNLIHLTDPNAIDLCYLRNAV